MSTGKVVKKGVNLTQDNFGFVPDERGVRRAVKRFTWRNRNKIQVQVITYGATITSIKLPDRNNNISDVVLGFDDIEGYVAYAHHYLGATIGRFANKILNGTFHINRVQHLLSKNVYNVHHSNGGHKGFDRVVWDAHVNNNAVVLSHLSPALSEGYPGDLLVQIVFELSQCNEFKVDISAQTTVSTIVNITNNLMFNLGGHSKGEEELHKHTVILNANCHTPLDADGFPTGAIMNVTNTKFDFQTPKILKHLMKDVPEGEYDQNFCVNRGVEQGNCFAGRVTHTPSGRVLEVYSNQSGVQLYTANRFPPEVTTTDSSSQISKTSLKSTKSLLEEDLEMVEKLHAEVCMTGQGDTVSYKDLRDLIKKIRTIEFKYEDATITSPPPNSPFTYEHNSSENSEFNGPILELTHVQIEYLTKMKMASLKLRHKDTDFPELYEIIQDLIDNSVRKETVERPLSSQIRDIPQEFVKYFGGIVNRTSKLASGKLPGTKDVQEQPRYKDGKIHGKHNAVYMKHAGLCLQTQNYPNAIYHKNFPNCVLHPGEKYCHTIVYKFWIQDGYPNNWIKRDFFCPPYKYY